MDTSALVKAYVEERGSAWMAALVENEQIVLSTLAIAEMASALARRTRERRLNMADARVAFENFRRDLTRFELLDTTVDVISSAALSMLRTGAPPLRAADAIHLATALQSSILLRRSDEDPPMFVVADKRLRDAARAAGVRVENPEDHP